VSEQTLQARAERLAETRFLGGPPWTFERLGRHGLEVLLREGLTPQSRVLDVGCGALRLGYWLARARGSRIIATIDADGQYEPEELGRVVQPILDNRADFVSGSRRLGAELTTDKIRHLGVLVFGALISAIVRHRITDPACGIRAMRSEVTGAVTLEQSQYQASELMSSAALNGYRLGEVPTTMRDRGKHATGTKKGGNFGYGVRFARAAIHTWRRDRNAARNRLRPEKIQRS